MQWTSIGGSAVSCAVFLPLATSVDGRQFAFQASLHQLQLQTGGYVVLEDEGGDRRLGQVLTMRQSPR